MLLFNRYEYNSQKDLIGKGGFARVYKAFDNKYKRYLALKIYKTNEFSERYGPIAEIQRVIELDHPNIARYLDINEIDKEDSLGQQEKIQVCMMELLEGGNLANYYDTHKDLNVFKKLLIDVLQGLSYLHKNGIIHRDIKPANILIKNTVEGPIPKITDFGISKRSDASSSSSNSALIVSIPYMAPEQLNARKYGIDGKIQYNMDLWSLGVAVYEIITGEVLFKNNDYDSSEQIMANIIAPDLPEKIKLLPAPFDDFVSRCIIKDANKRIKTAEELISLLQEKPKETPSPEIKQNDPAPSQSIFLDEGKAEDIAAGREAGSISVLDEMEPVTEDTVFLGQPKEQQPAVTPGIQDEDGVEEKPSLPSSEENASKSLPGNATEKNEDAGSKAEKSLAHGTKEEEVFQSVPIDVNSKNKADNAILFSKAPEERELGKISLFHRYDYIPSADLIGKGGFSRVYKAYDKKLSRWVALKIYKTSEFADRYSPIAEIKRVINLDHSNICRYLDIEEIEKENPFGENEKIQVCVMELLDSGNFADFYHKSDRDPEVLKKLVQDVLNGISYLHKNGIIHRDIKPANILIKKTIEGPVAKITDFGISKLSDTINSNSSSALIVSIPYMAPEQLNPRRYGIKERISYNLDLWSLGVTIYEVMTGQILFKNSEQDSSEQIMANIMAPELPGKINELPQPFRNIVACCIVKNANERAQKAEELLGMLNSTFSDIAPKAIPVTEKPDLPAPVLDKTILSVSSDAEPSPNRSKKKASEISVSVNEPAEAKDQWKKFTVVESTHELEKKARKHISYLKISIAVAALVFIAILLLYLFANGRF